MHLFWWICASRIRKLYVIWICEDCARKKHCHIKFTLIYACLHSSSLVCFLHCQSTQTLTRYNICYFIVCRTWWHCLAFVLAVDVVVILSFLLCFLSCFCSRRMNHNLNKCAHWTVVEKEGKFAEKSSQVCDCRSLFSFVFSNRLFWFCWFMNENRIKNHLLEYVW